MELKSRSAFAEATARQAGGSKENIQNSTLNAGSRESFGGCPALPSLNDALTEGWVTEIHSIFAIDRSR